MIASWVCRCQEIHLHDVDASGDDRSDIVKDSGASLVERLDGATKKKSLLQRLGANEKLGSKAAKNKKADKQGKPVLRMAESERKLQVSKGPSLSQGT